MTTKTNLIEVNKYNKRGIGRKFLPGGNMNDPVEQLPMYVGWTQYMDNQTNQATPTPPPTNPNVQVKNTLWNQLTDFSASGLGGQIVNALSPIAGGMANEGISGGLNSKAGGLVNTLGSTVGGVVGLSNPLLGAAITVGSGAVGGLTNRVIGTKLNQQNINDIKENIAGMRASANSLAGAGNQDTLMDNWANTDMGYDFSNGYVGKDGWLRSSAKRKARALRNQQATARGMAVHGLMTGADQIDRQQQDNMLANFAAYGGPMKKTLMALGGRMYTPGGVMDDYVTEEPVYTVDANEAAAADNYQGHAGFNDPNYGYVYQLAPVGIRVNDDPLRMPTVEEAKAASVSGVKGLGNAAWEMTGIPSMGRIANGDGDWLDYASVIPMFRWGKLGKMSKIGRSITAPREAVRRARSIKNASAARAAEAGRDVAEGQRTVFDGGINPETTGSPFVDDEPIVIIGSGEGAEGAVGATEAAMNSWEPVIDGLGSTERSAMKGAITRYTKNPNDKTYESMIRAARKHGVSREELAERVKGQQAAADDFAARAETPKEPTLFDDTEAAAPEPTAMEEPPVEEPTPTTETAATGSSTAPTTPANPKPSTKPVNTKSGRGWTKAKKAGKWIGNMGLFGGIGAGLNWLYNNSDSGSVDGPDYLPGYGPDSQAVNGADTTSVNAADTTRVAGPDTIQANQPIQEQYGQNNDVVYPDGSSLPVRPVETSPERHVVVEDFNDFGMGGALDAGNYFSKGGGIHINPKNKGKFTETMRRTGKTAEELLHSKNPLTRKRAQFAINARKWNHKRAEGGSLYDIYPVVDDPYSETGQLEDVYDYGDGTLMALGGDLQSHGADWGNGLREINAGGSHEDNKYDGVQQGIAEDGAPNLLEEGETVDEDQQFVYSNRIVADEDALARLRLGKKGKGKTYAAISKMMAEESKERPNDPISRAALKKRLRELAEAQEDQKQREQEAEAMAAFEALTPEQQQMVLQQMQQDQAGPGASMPSSEDEAPAAQEEGQEEIEWQPEEAAPVDLAAEEQEVPEGQYARGGKMGHKFPDGGWVNGLQALLGLMTESDWNKWLKDNKFYKAGPTVPMTYSDLQNYDFDKNRASIVAVLKKDYPELAHAIENGYDFGQYQYTNPRNLTFDFKHGGWGNEDYAAWNGSTDAAWREAVEKGLVRDGMTSEEIRDALMQTNAWERGNDWLKANDENRLAYLNAILNGEAPDDAKTYARRFVENGKWKNGVNHGFADIFGDETKGEGVRFTHPGTYWKTPQEVLRENATTNYLRRADGTIERMLDGTVPNGWTPANTYSYQTPNGDYTLNYYAEPAKEDVIVQSEQEGQNGQEGEKERQFVPFMKARGINAPMWADITQMAMHVLGIGKPNTSRLEASVNGIQPEQAGARYIGDYMTYTPMDIWSEQNRADQSSRATARAIANNALPTASKNAALLANEYNRQEGNGTLAAAARQYNDRQRQTVAGFNRGTNAQNANAFNTTSQFNARMRQAANNARAAQRAEVEATRMNAQNQWDQALYQGIANMGQHIYNNAKETRRMNNILLGYNLGDYAPMVTDVLDEWGRNQYGRRWKGVKKGTN